MILEYLEATVKLVEILDSGEHPDESLVGTRTEMATKLISELKHFFCKNSANFYEVKKNGKFIFSVIKRIPIRMVNLYLFYREKN